MGSDDRDPLKDEYWNMLDALDWAIYRDVERIRENRRTWDGRNWTTHPSAKLWLSTARPAYIEARLLMERVALTGRKGYLAPRCIIDPLWRRDLDFFADTALGIILVDKHTLIG
jgi:hypothetical protein